MILNEADRARLRRLELAVAEMPQTMRDIFLMHRLESLDYPEIARRLGVSPSAVEQQLAGAMLRLAQALESGAGGGPG